MYLLWSIFVLLYGRMTERKTNVLGLKLLQAINYRYARMSPQEKQMVFEQKPFVKRFNEHFSGDFIKK